jgi:hypothetical protein
MQGFKLVVRVFRVNFSRGMTRQLHPDFLSYASVCHRAVK